MHTAEMHWFMVSNKCTCEKICNQRYYSTVVIVITSCNSFTSILYKKISGFDKDEFSRMYVFKFTLHYVYFHLNQSTCNYMYLDKIKLLKQVCTQRYKFVIFPVEQN